jgi:hypothetical protein
MMSSNKARYLVDMSYEFLLVVSPVIIYVLLEAVHKDNYNYIFISPEWGIATIFLSFQGVALYLKALFKSNRTINHNFIGLLILIMVFLTIGSIINTYAAFSHKNVDYTIVKFKFLLFFIAFFKFSFLTLSAINIKNHVKGT